ncbi:ENR1 protein, partial [Pomatostomus ruficeps]|nr:ENR1 protein [Pomatostomus ruficeps]
IQREKLYECITKEPNPFHGEPQISKFWNKISINTVTPSKYWRAPKGLFWLCGKMAYVTLPMNWVGSCTLGIIRPSFFLLPRVKGQHLGVPPL